MLSSSRRFVAIRRYATASREVTPKYSATVVFPNPRQTFPSLRVVYTVLAEVERAYGPIRWFSAKTVYDSQDYWLSTNFLVSFREAHSIPKISQSDSNSHTIHVSGVHNSLPGGLALNDVLDTFSSASGTNLLNIIEPKSDATSFTFTVEASAQEHKIDQEPENAIIRSPFANDNVVHFHENLAAWGGFAPVVPVVENSPDVLQDRPKMRHAISHGLESIHKPNPYVYSADVPADVAEAELETWVLETLGLQEQSWTPQSGLVSDASLVSGGSADAEAQSQHSVEELFSDNSNLQETSASSLTEIPAKVLVSETPSPAEEKLEQVVLSPPSQPFNGQNSAPPIVPSIEDANVDTSSPQSQSSPVAAANEQPIHAPSTPTPVGLGLAATGIFTGKSSGSAAEKQPTQTSTKQSSTARPAESNPSAVPTSMTSPVSKQKAQLQVTASRTGRSEKEKKKQPQKKTVSPAEEARRQAARLLAAEQADKTLSASSSKRKQLEPSLDIPGTDAKPRPEGAKAKVPDTPNLVGNMKSFFGGWF